MLFAELVHAIHPYLMKDADVPEFMRTLIQMLCDIPEEDWTTKKDPSSEQANKDASLRKFYTKGPTKKLAKSMLGRLTKYNFVESINYDRTDVVKESLVESLRPFHEDVDTDNVGEVLFELFKKSLEFIVNPEMENERRINLAKAISTQAKASFGSALLADCDHICSMTGCGKSLQIEDDTKNTIDDYEAACINGSKNIAYKSFVSLCHNCFQKYTFKQTKVEERKLQAIKKVQMQIRDSKNTLDEIAIEKGISQVIQNLSRAKAKDFVEISYSALSVAEKIDENEHGFLFNQVMSDVTKYFLFVEKTMQNAVKKKMFNDGLLRAQIKAAYEKLADKKNSPEQIYAALSERLRAITKQDIFYCYIVIAYFIQSCEVFDASAK
jgi:hypothetical protein